MHIWVLGATGLVGSTLCPYLREQGHSVITQRAHGDGADVVVDLMNYNALSTALDAQLNASSAPDVIINLAALTNVDICQEQPDLAFRMNTLLMENLVCWLRGRAPNTHLIHISTDAVYDGDGESREDQVRMTNTYAITKYSGDLAAQTHAGVATVLRINLVGKSLCEERQTLSDWLVGSLQRQDPIRLLEDVWFAPLELTQLSQMIERVAQRPKSGIFNLGARGGFLKADFAEQLAEGLGLSLANAERKYLEDFDFSAPRAKNMGMDVSRFEQAFDITLPDMSQVIERLVDMYSIENNS